MKTELICFVFKNLNVVKLSKFDNVKPHVEFISIYEYIYFSFTYPLSFGASYVGQNYADTAKYLIWWNLLTIWKD